MDEIVDVQETRKRVSRKRRKLANEHGKLTNAQIVKMTGANRNTVKKHLQSLVVGNHLAQHGTGKGTWYGRS